MQSMTGVQADHDILKFEESEGGNVTIEVAVVRQVIVHIVGDITLLEEECHAIRL